jgi:hypothetical protein
MLSGMTHPQRSTEYGILTCAWSADKEMHAIRGTPTLQGCHSSYSVAKFVL